MNLPPSRSPDRPCSHLGCPRRARPAHAWCTRHLIAASRYGYAGHRRITEREIRPHRRAVEYVVRGYAASPLVREYVAEMDRLLQYRAATEIRLEATIERAMLTARDQGVTARDQGVTARDLLEAVCVPYLIERSTAGRFASAEHVDRVAAWAALRFGGIHPRNTSGGVAAFLGRLIRERFARFAYTVASIYERDLTERQARQAALADPAQWPTSDSRARSVRFPRAHKQVTR